MGRIGMPEIIFTAVVIMLLFGTKRLPEIGASIGQAIKEFKKAMKDSDADVKPTVEDKTK